MPTDDTGETVGIPSAVPLPVQRPSSNMVAYWGFHEEVRQKFMGYAFQRLGTDADAEEVVDNVFDYLLMHWNRVLGMEHWKAYAWKVLKNRITDRWRRMERRPEMVDIAAFEAIGTSHAKDAYDTLADNLELYAAVRLLPERQRDAIVLCHTLGHSPGEAAELMGIETATVHSHLCQARPRLAEILQATYDDCADDQKKA